MVKEGFARTPEQVRLTFEAMSYLQGEYWIEGLYVESYYSGGEAVRLLTQFCSRRRRISAPIASSASDDSTAAAAGSSLVSSVRMWRR